MTEQPILLFLDCDPGIDDAIALAYLHCQPDVRTVGVAASGGNVSTAQVVENTLGWLALAGRSDLSVHPGADYPLAQLAQLAAGEHAVPEFAEETHGDSGSGYATLPGPEHHPAPHPISAAQAWVDAARAHPGELVGVLTGPATNLALALEIEPRLPRLLRRLFVMGGAFNYRGNTRPTTEWNVSFDPEAAARVFAAFGDAFLSGAAPAPAIAPIEATEAVEMTPERLARISAAAAPAEWLGVLRELGEALRFYFEFHAEDGHGYLAHIHDPYVLAAALEWARRDSAAAHAPATTDRSARAAAADSRLGGEPATIPWAQTRLAPVDVELTGTLTRGETVADWLGRWNRPANAEVIRHLDAGSFLDHLEDTLKKGPTHD